MGPIRRVVEDVLAELDGQLDVMYFRKGRRSVPPEALLRATVLVALYSIRSERAFCERLNYDLLFKWFLDMPIDAKAFDPTMFTKASGVAEEIQAQSHPAGRRR